MSDGETVWVLSRASNGGEVGGPKLHTDPDCPALIRADREPTAKSREAFAGSRDTCRFCAGRAADPTSGPSDINVAPRLERRQAVHDALAEAGGPLSKQEIKLEAMLSDGQIKRVLSDLRELGQVEQVENPDDGRIPLYRLASMCPTGPQRGRAQVSPIALGLLTLLLGLLWVLGVFIASGVMP